MLMRVFKLAIKKSTGKASLLSQNDDESSQKTKSSKDAIGSPA